MKIIVASRNANKVLEIKAVLDTDDYEIYSMHEAGVEVDIEETGSSFEENALIKARFVAKVSGETAIADDSGLEVDFLDKQPGIYSARFGGENTPYSVKNKMILDKLIDVPYEKRTARYVCSMAAAFPDGDDVVVTKTLEGYIAEEPVGELGFGYDPIFYVPEFDMTVAQMELKLKNEISHRGKALRALSEALKKRKQNRE